MRRPLRSSGLIRCAALLALALAGVATSPPTRSQPGEVAQSWLLRTCDLGSDEALARMRAEEDEVDKVLLAAFREGPPAAILEEVAEAARERFALRRRALAAPEAVGLARSDLSRARRVTEREYVERALHSLRLGYRTQALRGLLALRPDIALPLLSREASDPDSPLRGTAARLLEQMQR
jgi:hypothetical protein